MAIAGPQVAAGAVAAQDPPAEACRRIDLRPAPRWSISGAWVDEGRALALVDIEGQAILRYGADGSFLGEDGEFDHPSTLYERPDGTYVLKDGATRWVALDKALEPIASVDLRFWAVEGPTEEGWIGGMGPAGVAGEELVMLVPIKTETRVVYSQIRLTPDDWSRKGPRSPGEPGARLAGVAVPDFDGHSEQYLGLTAPVTASVGGKVFMLGILDDDLGIYEMTDSDKRLEAFPEGFSRDAPLPPDGGRDSDAERFAYLESVKIPAGLYSRGDTLYLLTREPTADGTVWKLHAIDPRRDRITRSIRLPTHANHLFLVPGPTWWAVVEKGAVGAAGQQPIPSAVLVPSPWIEDPASNALTGDAPSCGHPEAAPPPRATGP